MKINVSDLSDYLDEEENVGQQHHVKKMKNKKTKFHDEFKKQDNHKFNKHKRRKDDDDKY